MKKELHERHELSGRGISVRRLNYLLAGVTLAISALLLIAAWQARQGYEDMRGYTENFIRWQRDAYDMQLGSDYLTEQVRCFVETGERRYLEAYFQEVNVTRRREKALESVKSYLGESEAYRSLEAAMRQSTLLMDREYYAMRLVAEALDYNLLDLPEPVRNVPLRPGEAAMASQVQLELARSMVFDQVYHERKMAISANMDACLAALAGEVEVMQVETADRLERILNRQQLFIIVLIIIAVLTMLLTLFLVILPLIRAVGYIRAEQPLPLKGSYEFRFLAKTYNLMFEAGREKTEQLAFEATHDKLTGVYNRSGYDFLLKNADMETSALLVLDIDKFKGFNDTYGHETGDRVLIRVADVLRSSFRSRDYVCRIGGDEFVIILVHAAALSGDMIVEKLKHINDLLMSPREEGMPPVSLSCGVAFGSGGGTGEELFRRADAALYEVKRNGGRGCRVGNEP